MKYLVSDVKHIKKLLRKMQKYILNKSIEGNKVNDVKDLEDVGEVAWGFISALYKSHWDHLITNKNNFSFRHKVKAQFSSQIIKEVTPKEDKEKDKLTVVSVLLPPILAKSSKKVVKIPKFFKKNLENKGKKIVHSSIICKF